MITDSMRLSPALADDFITIDGHMSFFNYKTVKELSVESGVSTKNVSKIVKVMLHRGYAIRRGNSYKYPNGR
jgi:DNA-binding MarR family transcriptional regulator